MAETGSKFSKLTFSQRIGEVDMPEPYKLGTIPTRFRNLVWLKLESAIERHREFGYDVYRPGVGKSINKIICTYQFNIEEKPHDKIKANSPDTDRFFVRSIVLDGEYHVVLTFIEYFLQHRQCPENLSNHLIKVFDETSVAYIVQKVNGLPSITPRVSRESGETTRQAIEAIIGSGMASTATHFRKAAKHINNGEHGDSIRESIHAIESIARVIDPESNKTLSPALKSLENKRVLKHPALTKAFNVLYGYTNDEQGIRHALIDKDAADVGVDESMFIFGACASFAAYLVNKHRQFV